METDLTTVNTVNQPAETVDQIINESVQLAEKAIDASAEAALDAAAPIFAAPVIHQVSDVIIEEIVKLIGDQVSVGLQTIGTFIVIDTQISSEQTGISEALANLVKAEKSGDPIAIQAAIQAYANAQSALVHDDGSATPATS